MDVLKRIEMAALRFWYKRYTKIGFWYRSLRLLTLPLGGTMFPHFGFSPLSCSSCCRKGLPSLTKEYGSSLYAWIIFFLSLISRIAPADQGMLPFNPASFQRSLCAPNEKKLSAAMKVLKKRMDIQGQMVCKNVRACVIRF